MSILPTGSIGDPPYNWGWGNWSNYPTWESSKPATVITAKIPCECGTQLDVQFNMGDYFEGSYPSITCPKCSKVYTLRADIEKPKNGGLETK